MIYIMGEVGHPGAIPLTDAHSMTVLQAVSMSGRRAPHGSEHGENS